MSSLNRLAGTHGRRAAAAVMAGLAVAGPVLSPVVATAAPTESEVTIDQDAYVRRVSPATSDKFVDVQAATPAWSRVEDGSETFARDVDGFGGVTLATLYDDASGSVVAWRPAEGAADHFATTLSVADDGSLSVRVTPDGTYWNGEHDRVTMTAPAIRTTLDANGGSIAGGNAKDFSGSWELPADGARTLVAGDDADASSRPHVTIADAYEAPTRAGYTFVGWNTKADGTGTSYPDAPYVRYAGTTLYAQWVPNAYTVSFDGNGAEGTQADVDATYDADLTLPEPAFSYEGQDFLGYNTEADGSGTAYQPGDSVRNLTADAGGKVTLYAQWDTNVAISVPTTVPFHIKSDGSVVTPSNWSVRNVGRTAIETADVTVRDASPDVSYAADVDGADWFGVRDGAVENGGHLTLKAGEEKAVDWSMDPVDHDLAKGEDGLVHAGSLSFDFTRVG